MIKTFDADLLIIANTCENVGVPNRVGACFNVIMHIYVTTGLGVGVYTCVAVNRIVSKTADASATL